MAGDDDLERTGELLIEAGIITAEEIEKALEEAGPQEKKTAEAVRGSGLPRRAELAAFLAMDFTIPETSLQGLSVSKDILKLVPEDFARKHVLMPVALLGRAILVVARPNAFNRAAVIALRKMTGMKVAVLKAGETEVENAINANYLGMPFPRSVPLPSPSPSGRKEGAKITATPGFETAHFPTLEAAGLDPALAPPAGRSPSAGEGPRGADLSSEARRAKEEGSPSGPASSSRLPRAESKPEPLPAPSDDLAHSLLMTPDEVASGRAPAFAPAPRKAEPAGEPVDLLDSLDAVPKPALPPARPAPAPPPVTPPTFSDNDLRLDDDEEEAPKRPVPAAETKKIAIPQRLAAPADDRAAMANRSTAMMLMAQAATEEDLSKARRESFQVAVEEWERTFTQDHPLLAIRMSK